MKIIALFLFLAALSSKSYACDKILGKWKCVNQGSEILIQLEANGDYHKLNLARDSFSMGQYDIDYGRHFTQNSDSIEVSYIGSCQNAIQLYLSIEYLFKRPTRKRVTHFNDFRVQNDGRLQFVTTEIQDGPNAPPSKTYERLCDKII